MKRSKIHTLSYIEETPKHHQKLVKVATMGVKKGIASAKAAGLYITYASGGKIVREYPDGKIQVIGKLDSTPRIVDQDARFTLR